MHEALGWISRNTHTHTHTHTRKVANTKKPLCPENSYDWRQKASTEVNLQKLHLFSLSFPHVFTAPESPNPFSFVLSLHSLSSFLLNKTQVLTTFGLYLFSMKSSMQIKIKMLTLNKIHMPVNLSFVSLIFRPQLQNIQEYRKALFPPSYMYFWAFLFNFLYGKFWSRSIDNKDLPCTHPLASIMINYWSILLDLHSLNLSNYFEVNPRYQIIVSMNISIYITRKKTS
jgi:hypothetical protein